MRQTWVSAEKFILSREFFGMKLGLENIGQFLADLGTPQSKFKSIHLAGTNGKGSTASMIASVLQEAGYRTGLFTSPHLVTLRERVRINGQMIPRRSVTAFIDRNRRELARRKISFFELITAMALDHFARSKVQVAVIETGLGGRLDATNVLNPHLTLTTSVGFDHTEILGNTLSKIAFEKAGIIKPSVPHVIGFLQPDAEKVIRRRCKDIGAKLFKLNPRDYHVSGNDCFDFVAHGTKLSGLKPSLSGPHQIDNALLAVKSLALLKKNGFKITYASIKQGLKKTQFAGRFQIFKKRGWPLHILDVGHNAAGIDVFVKTFCQQFPERKAKILTGFVRLKQHQQMISSLGKIAESFAMVPLKTKRSTDLNGLLSSIDFGGIATKKFSSLTIAHRHLLKSTVTDDIIIVVGSHYLVGEFLSKYGK